MGVEKNGIFYFFVYRTEPFPETIADIAECDN